MLNNQSQQSDPITDAFNAVNSAANGNVMGLFNQMMATNPTFRDFVGKYGSLQPEQVARDLGMSEKDIQSLKALIGKRGPTGP